MKAFHVFRETVFMVMLKHINLKNNMNKLFPLTGQYLLSE